MNTTLTKQEIDFLLNILLPNSLDDLHEGEHKSKIKLLLDIHNPKLIASIDSQLFIKNVSLEEYYEQAFKNTVSLFFAQKKQNYQKKYFSIASIYDHKSDFLKLLKFNTFYNIGKRIFAVQFYLFLDHLYQTFETLESYDRSSKLSRGTDFLTSGYRIGLDTTYKQLQDEYNLNRDFPIEAIDTREKIQVNLFSVKTFRNHRSVANFMIICNAMHNLNDLKIDLTEGQSTGFKQSFSILNGLKTSKEEVIRSFMIKTYFPYYRKEKINKKMLASITHKIAETFFPNIVYPREGTSHICEFDDQRRINLIAHFLKKNHSFELFEKLSLEPQGSSWSGSRIPSLQKEVDFYKSLIKHMDNIHLLQHKQKMEQNISYLKHDIEREKKNDFMEDDY